MRGRYLRGVDQIEARQVKVLERELCCERPDYDGEGGQQGEIDGPRFVDEQLKCQRQDDLA